METRKIGLEEITKMIDPIVGMRTSDWYLVTAEHEGVANTLTAAWGGFGNVCEKKVATVYIRPQRHTKKFMDASGRFTMTYCDYEKYAKALVYLGSHSGADEPDKIQELFVLPDDRYCVNDVANRRRDVVEDLERVIAD